MAQECMAIFEKDKLPAIASVEQVSEGTLLVVLKLTSTSTELRYRAYTGGKDTQDFGRGDGPTVRQPGRTVSAVNYPVQE